MATPTDAEHAALLFALRNLVPAVWPVLLALGERQQISSAFGPRLPVGEGSYWHRGIDIVAPPSGGAHPVIRAVRAGQVDQPINAGNYGGLGTLIRIKHDLPAPITYGTLQFNHYWTLYGHLASAAVVDNQHVAAGQQVGVMGKSGAATGIHLHLELRFGTKNSLEYQQANQSNPNVLQADFDPHLNPLLLFPPVTVPDDKRASLRRGAGPGTVVEFSCLGELPALNKVRAWAPGWSPVPQELDYNRRTGYDPSTEAALDQAVLDAINAIGPPPEIRIRPQHWQGSCFRTDVQIPPALWQPGLPPGIDPTTYRFYDIWDEPIDLSSAIFMRDCPADIGDHPSPCGTLWASPDILPRQAQDPSHGLNLDPIWSTVTPEVIEAGHDNYVYVRVRNGACRASTATVRLYWANLSTFVPPTQWHEVSAASVSTGALASGATKVLEFIWPAADVPGAGHYCFVAVLAPEREEAYFEPAVLATAFSTTGQFQTWVREHNNVAWRNFAVVNWPFDLNWLQFSFEMAAAEPGEYELRIARWDLPDGTVLSCRSPVDASWDRSRGDPADPISWPRLLRVTLGAQEVVRVEAALQFAKGRQYRTGHLALAQFRARSNLALGGITWQIAATHDAAASLSDGPAAT